MPSTHRQASIRIRLEGHGPLIRVGGPIMAECLGTVVACVRRKTLREKDYNKDADRYGLQAAWQIV